MSEKKEYIERGALIKRLNSLITTSDLFGMGVQSGFSHAIVEANAIPAADVEPVVRGEWTMLTADLTDWSRETYVHWLKCSLCGKAVPLRSKSKFCPHCGAHMVERQCAMPFKTQSVEEEKKACADYFERAERSGSGE